MPRRNRSTHRTPGRNRSSRSKAERAARRRLNSDEPWQWNGKPADSRGGRGTRAVDTGRAPIEIVRCPMGKIGFTEADARRKLAEHAGSSRPNRPIRVYRCPKCGAWHLSSQPQRTERRSE